MRGVRSRGKEAKKGQGMSARWFGYWIDSFTGTRWLMKMKERKSVSVTYMVNISNISVM